MLFSQKLLRRILGALWLIDGLLQVQPQMFTQHMVDSVLLPIVQGQPAPIAASLQMLVTLMTQHLTLLNLLVAVVQVEIGLFLLLGIWVRGTVILSIVWALAVWYAGEGMGMLLTGQASVLTGAPGAVLLYPLLGLLVYPRKKSPAAAGQAGTDEEHMLLSPERFRLVLGGFWIFAALLQMQPYWWQPGQIAQAISDMVGQGGFNTILVDPVLRQLSTLALPLEVPLNLALSELFLGLGIALLFVKREWLRPLLVLSLVLSTLIWWGTQAFGLIFTGMSTDFNSGLLLVLMTLACWPRISRLPAVRGQQVQDVQPTESSAQVA